MPSPWSNPPTLPWITSTGSPLPTRAYSTGPHGVSATWLLSAAICARAAIISVSNRAYIRPKASSPRLINNPNRPFSMMRWPLPSQNRVIPSADKPAATASTGAPQLARDSQLMPPTTNPNPARA